MLIVSQVRIPTLSSNYREAGSQVPERVAVSASVSSGCVLRVPRSQPRLRLVFSCDMASVSKRLMGCKGLSFVLINSIQFSKRNYFKGRFTEVVGKAGRGRESTFIP